MLGVQAHMLAPRENFENMVYFSAFWTFGIYFDQIVS